MPTSTWPDAVGPQGPFGGGSNVILTVVWLEFALATVLISLRVFTRYWCGKTGGWALSWTGLSWLVGLLAQAFLTVAIDKSTHGFGPGWTVPNALTLSWTSIYLTFIAIGFGKIAVISFILALQGFTHIRQRYFLYFLAVSNMIINIVFVLYASLRCSPARDAFILGREASCNYHFTAARNFGFFAGAWNAITDLLLALYPLLLLRDLQLARPIKRGVTFVMSLGVFAFGCAAVKTYHLRWVPNTAQLDFKIYCVTIWSYTEMWVVLITCCIPPLWPLAKRILGHRSSSNYDSTHSSPNFKSHTWFGSNDGRITRSLFQSSASKHTHARSVSRGMDGSRAEMRETKALRHQRSRTPDAMSGSDDAPHGRGIPTSRYIAERVIVDTKDSRAGGVRSVTPSRGPRFLRSQSSSDKLTTATKLTSSSISGPSNPIHTASSSFSNPSSINYTRNNSHTSPNPNLALLNTGLTALPRLPPRSASDDITTTTSHSRRKGSAATTNSTSEDHASSRRKASTTSANTGRPSVDDIERALGSIHEVDDFGKSWDRDRPGIMVTREFTVEEEALSQHGGDGPGGERRMSFGDGTGLGVGMARPAVMVRSVSAGDEPIHLVAGAPPLIEGNGVSAHAHAHDATYGQGHSYGFGLDGRLPSPRDSLASAPKYRAGAGFSELCAGPHVIGSGANASVKFTRSGYVNGPHPPGCGVGPGGKKVLGGEIGSEMRSGMRSGPGIVSGSGSGNGRPMGLPEGFATPATPPGVMNDEEVRRAEEVAEERRDFWRRVKAGRSDIGGRGVRL